MAAPPASAANTNPAPIEISRRRPQPPNLPLGWTKVRRAKKRRLTDEGGDKKTWCCEDPNCEDQTKGESNSAKENARAGDDQGDDKKGSNLKDLRGHAVMLLPDVDSSWFQGHFIPSAPSHDGKSKPMGLLAVNRTDTDECLKCAEGGYREVDLTVYSYTTSSNKKGNKQTKSKKIKFDRAVCTGGDLIRLRAKDRKTTEANPSRVIFDASRVMTGSRATPYVLKYFSSVVQKLSSKHTVKGKEVADLLPDCAVVVGDMRLKVPTEFVKGVDRAGDNDEMGWMSD